MAAGRASTRILSTNRFSNSGFTLIELLIVVAIIAILAAILIPNFFRSRAQATVAASKSNMRNLALALEVYRTVRGDYPTDDPPIVLKPDYIREIPDDPCGGVFGYKRYDDGSGFRLDSNNGKPWGGFCTITGLTGIFYTTEGGLQTSP